MTVAEKNDSALEENQVTSIEEAQQGAISSDYANAEGQAYIKNKGSKKKKPKRRIKDADGTIIVMNRVKAIVYTVVLSFVLLSALFIMLCIDINNYMRPAFLDNSIFVTILETLGIERQNITRNGWVVFFTIASATVVFVIAAYCMRGARNRFGKWTYRATKSDKGARLLFGFLYFMTLTIILAVIVGILSANGMYTFYNVDMQGQNVEGAELFVNVIYTLAVFLGLIMVIPLFIFIIFLIIKFIDLVIKLLGGGRTTDEELENAKKRGIGGKGGEGDGGKGLNKLDKDSKITIAQEEKDMSGYRVFPSLTEIDRFYKANPMPEHKHTAIELKDLIFRLQSYLSNKQKLYFEINTLQCFMAGLAASRLMILEGLSGTGKSSLPRFFMEFINEKVYFCAVQATWRDRTDVIGYYNDFSKEFKETQFLKQLYSSKYRAETINLMVLDELNLSRIEYYFADFLSVLEYPAPDWKILLMQTSKIENPPHLLDDGQVIIPTNTWFIGTANKDDSTFTITDKVYDRAVVIDFYQKNAPIHTDYESEPIYLSASGLLKMFDDAQANSEYRLNDEDLEKFGKLCDFVQETFEVTFGNRIMNQIENFTPVFVACGGTKDEALDFMFARKVMRKLEGKFDDYIKDGLDKMLSLITKAYGKDVFKHTEHAIVNLRKKLV